METFRTQKFQNSDKERETSSLFGGAINTSLFSSPYPIYRKSTELPNIMWLWFC